MALQARPSMLVVCSFERFRVASRAYSQAELLPLWNTRATASGACRTHLLVRAGASVAVPERKSKEPIEARPLETASH
eukprot:11342652-Alexandrium_andersonii.AAC.1